VQASVFSKQRDHGAPQLRRDGRSSRPRQSAERTRFACGDAAGKDFRAHMTSKRELAGDGALGDEV
jgi:hypothetical protein